MSAIAAISLADGQGTPVTHTFSPVNINNDVAKWLDRVDGIAIGMPAITLSLRQPTKTSRNYKALAKIVVPVLEVTAPSTSTGIQPAPTKAYDLTATVEFILPERATAAQRADLFAFTKNLFANAFLSASVLTLESVY